MLPLTELIGSREIDVTCRPCGWTEPRPVNWLKDQRHMLCPSCAEVIVLDTSDLRRQIASVHRQMSLMHKQLAETIPAAQQRIFRDAAQPKRGAGGSPPKLALVEVYSEKTGRQSNDPRLERGRHRLIADLCTERR